MKKFAALFTVILTAVVIMGTAQVMKAEAAAYPLKKISPQEVAVLIETQRPIAIIDVRSLPDFKAGHIPMASLRADDGRRDAFNDPRRQQGHRRLWCERQDE